MLDKLTLQRQLLTTELSRLEQAIACLPPLPPQAWRGPARAHYWFRLLLVKSEANRAYAELRKAVAATTQAEKTMANRG